MLNMPEIGEHHKIITFEKNENPQNIMVVYTKLDANCHFVKKDGQPLIDFYWLMDKHRFKPTHPLIKDAVRQRLEVHDAKDDLFTLKISDIKEIDAKMADTYFEVRVERKNGVCHVATYFPHDGKRVAVNSMFSESKRTLLPPFRKLLAVTIRGIDPQSGNAFNQRYTAR